MGFVSNFLLVAIMCFLVCNAVVDAQFNYGQALTKSLLYFEAQRSGRLPANQRVNWRADSALNDGSDAKIDLTGGYYDAGDNVKFGFPMAFTITMLSWGVVEFESQLAARKELDNARAAIRWGTDYLIRAHAGVTILVAEVGDGNSDHACWQRPEDMTTPRTSYRVNEDQPGSDIAAETAAALAAAAIVFKSSDPKYSSTLLTHAEQLFDLARLHRGKYSDSIPVAQNFYTSSGFDDELLWASAWLHRATGIDTYRDFLDESETTGGVRSELSWDDKFVGAQVLVTQSVLDMTVPDEGKWAEYKSNAEEFMCNVMQKGPRNTKRSPGGVLWFQPWNNLQYTTAALLVLSAHADHLAAADESLGCSGGTVTPNDIISFVREQVDYILGANPKRMSYMVGFGDNYPKHVHHRAASIVSFKKDPTPTDCKGGFDKWFNAATPNPNVLEGAIVGGPDSNDAYTDSRSNFQQSEAGTVNTAPLVGVLARLA